MTHRIPNALLLLLCIKYSHLSFRDSAGSRTKYTQLPLDNYVIMKYRKVLSIDQGMSVCIKKTFKSHCPEEKGISIHFKIEGYTLDQFK